MFIGKLACGFAAALCVASGSAWADNLAVTSVPGYEILEYLESSGTQYIDTGIVYANDTKLSQRFCIVDFAGAQMQMGALDTVSGVNHRFHWGCRGGVATLEYIAGVGIGGNPGGISAGSDGWVDLTLDATSVSSAFTESGHSTLRIFGRMSNNSGYSTANPARIADVVIYESGVKTHEFIPFRRESDGVLGLYDVIGKQFLVNSGSAEGGFVAGPELQEEGPGGFVR